jgi:prepilin-type N-terminal cleavage/methylation domain-containing protein
MRSLGKGFTLVELAIVLVIIGFLLAMGLKGAQLVRTAKIQKEAYKFKKIAAAIGTYYNTHSRMPGDGNGCVVNPNNPGHWICSPADGIIQFYESGPAMWQLEWDGLIDDDTRKIADMNYFFSAGGWVPIDHSNRDDWTTIYYFDPGKVWNSNTTPQSSTEFGNGAFTVIVVADLEYRRVTMQENNGGGGSCDDDCTDGVCDLNGDKDCNDSWTFSFPSDVRSGPADGTIYEIDCKYDATCGWASGEIRTALRYDQTTGRYYRLNTQLNDADGDGRPEVDDDNKIYYFPSTRNQNFVATRAW